ncbi:MAG: hypothetical protein SFW36_09795 [Leptolyngbyaceae cyanobacterium bins.59]|nr:hypothetical protein [Leptolyngbyaceae cyanobacterium bins.59]
MKKILQEDTSYSFRSYFELANDPDEVLAEFGYDLKQLRLNLPTTDRPILGLKELQQQIEETLPFVQLTSETAKREVLVAPVLTRVAVISQQTLRIEYPLKVTPQLQGTLDYLIRSRHNLIVVEAKRDDLTRGFTQLAVEMIALSMVEESPNFIYGAVTIGNLWIFSILDRNTQIITQDISSYTLPDDLEPLIRTLVGILE